jgi:hypothetical protein
MVDLAIVRLSLFLVGLVLLFNFGLLTSQRFNSPRLFYSNSIICILLAIYMPIYSKYHSPWALDNSSDAAEFSAGTGFLFALKFLGFAFGQDWIFARKMTPKQVALKCLTFPLTTESSTEKSFEREVGARRESIYTILRGLCKIVVLRVLFRVIPLEWFSLPPSAFFPFLWPVRYALLGVIVYLHLAMSFDIILGFTGLLFNIRMNSSFPSSPFLATSLRDFWSRRWDMYVKTVLHRTCFVVIPRLTGTVTTMNKTASALLSFALSGVLHEFILMMVTDRWSGKTVLFFILNGVLITIEIAIKLPAMTTNPTGKLAGWAWTMGALLVTSPFFFDPLIEAGYYIRLKESFS